MSQQTATSTPRTAVGGSQTPSWRLVLFSSLAGVALSIIWSFHFVDSVIGDNIASALMGEDADAVALDGIGIGAAFAFVSGMGGTFTACNAAAVSAIVPMGEAGRNRYMKPSWSATLGAIWAPVGWLTLGMASVSATYGFFGVLFSDFLPQLSSDVLASGMPIRLVQASAVFGVIGLAFVWLGLASLNVVTDVFENNPVARVVFLGAIAGAFLVGRPFPLFNKLFHWAAEQGNPVMGAAIFVLQSLGNVALMVVLYTALGLIARGAALRWLTASPQRAQSVSGALLLTLGTFTIVYWVVRIPASFGYGCFPVLPYN